MQLYLLHLDDALDNQTDFTRACTKAGAREIRLRQDGDRIRLWGYHADLTALRERLTHARGVEPEPSLVFMGSGDFHHVSAFLLASALDSHSGGITLVHIDNHPDWVTFEKGTHCGSWINRIIDHPLVRKIITVGVCSNDLQRPESKLANLSLLSQGLLELYPYDHEPSYVTNNYGIGASFQQVGNHLHWKTILAVGENRFIDYLLSRIDTFNVYLSIDKDVLSRNDAITNWDQGRMRLPYLLTVIKEISKHHRIVGADIIGDYSKPSYSGGLRARLSKHYEAFKDQPRGRPDPEEAAKVNNAVNRALLEVFIGAIA